MDFCYGRFYPKTTTRSKKCLKIFNKMLLETELKLNPSGNCQVLMLEICQFIKQLAGKMYYIFIKYILLLNIYFYFIRKKKPNKRIQKFF